MWVVSFRVADLRSFDRQLMEQGRARRPRYLEPEPECWMCPARGVPGSREHVFGRWIKKRLPTEALIFQPHRAGPYGLDFSDVRGPMPLNALQVGGVCASCNNGWMSSLEADAEQMIFGSDRDLSVADTLRLAHWAIKTAIIVNLSQPSPLIWPETDRHRVRNGPISRTAVSVLRVEGADANWAQGEMSSWGGPREGVHEATTLLGLVAKIRIRLNDIVLVVARLPWQMASCTISLPGRQIWDGRNAFPVSLDEVPLTSNWLDGHIAVSGDLRSAFWERPERDFWAATQH